ncbi:heme peroxidase [Microthyrium microscopicum]|uniref:Peroxidase n=1 Tax=Microthyrium microscopicum TaxID=703497 RepID=A0A6A6URX5_9PEZI|nr:heme peroxidase [Microthyrium microscopicum]
MRTSSLLVALATSTTTSALSFPFSSKLSARQAPALSPASAAPGPAVPIPAAAPSASVAAAHAPGIAPLGDPFPASPAGIIGKGAGGGKGGGLPDIPGMLTSLIGGMATGLPVPKPSIPSSGPSSDPDDDPDDDPSDDPSDDPPNGHPGLPNPLGGFPGGNPLSPSPKPSTPAMGGSCPAIWHKISADLVEKFTDGAPMGQCNDQARVVIRIAFHDCAAWQTSLGTSAGCDGSLYLAKEYTRSENAGIETAVPQFGALAQSYNVSVADFFQFAAAHAIVTCPLGPTVQTFVGRQDRTTANPEGLIPNPRASGSDIVQNMQDKGISPAELAALLGAHSCSKQFEFDPSKAGAALDTTPGIWDVDFYGQVLTKKAPFILPSDLVLSKQKGVSGPWKDFVSDQTGWDKAFAPAMTKMSLMGVTQEGLIDCTSALPPPKDSSMFRVKPRFARRSSFHLS